MPNNKKYLFKMWLKYLIPTIISIEAEDRKFFSQ